MNAEVRIEDVRAVLADCLAIDAASIEPGKSLIEEYGFDSLDFVDVVFGLEKKYQVKFRDGGFDRLLRVDLLENTAQGQSYVSVETLRKVMPYLPGLQGGEQNRTLTPLGVLSYITTESLVIALQELLQRKQERQ